MRSPIYALLWEIWRRHRRTIAVIVGLTAAGRLLDFSERAVGTQGSSAESSPLIELLLMISFALLFGVFNYTESSSGSRGIRRFPRRLFTLPVSSLRLVAVPVLSGIVSVELLYLLWMGLWMGSTGGSTSPLLIAVLLGALMVCYQAVLWTLDRLGPLRLVVVGAIAVIVFGIGLLPSFPPSPPPRWRSEAVLALLATGVAGLAFLLTWRHVVSLRGGGERGPLRLEQLIASAAAAIPTRRRAFASPVAAHFWFEWRSSGLVLPILVGGLLLIIVGPASWFVRHNEGDTWQLLLATLSLPVILAIPVGMGFSRPTLWSDDLSVPAFVAVLPLTDEDIVAIKVKVAAASVVITWLLVLSFLAVWLPGWASLDSVSRFAIQLWAFHELSVAAVYGIGVLIVIAGMFLTWRMLVSRLWSGLSGSRPLFITSVMSVVVMVIAYMVFDASRLPGWLLADPARMGWTAWTLSFAVITKYWLAAWSWRRVGARYLRQYLLVWCAGTVCFVIASMVVWHVVRIYVALDIYRFQSVVILIALLAMPLARVGLAPSSLARNRHR